jgi:hypothetical protein
MNVSGLTLEDPTIAVTPAPPQPRNVEVSPSRLPGRQLEYRPGAHLRATQRDRRKPTKESSSRQSRTLTGGLRVVRSVQDGGQLR